MGSRQNNESSGDKKKEMILEGIGFSFESSLRLGMMVRACMKSGFCPIYSEIYTFNHSKNERYYSEIMKYVSISEARMHMFNALQSRKIGTMKYVVGYHVVDAILNADDLDHSANIVLGFLLYASSYDLNIIGGGKSKNIHGWIFREKEVHKMIMHGHRKFYCCDTIFEDENNLRFLEHLSLVILNLHG